MEDHYVSLYRSASLEPGRVRLPGGAAESGVSLCFGCARAAVTQAEGAPDGEVHLAADLWEALAIPYTAMRLRLRQTAPDQWELGPAVAVLYPGRVMRSERAVAERAALYYGHRYGEPGLLAFGFDEAIDWERRRCRGWVLDNRPGREGELVQAWFPIPTAVRLTWSIRRDVIERLRALTGNRAFNWVRSIGKWQFHSLLAAHEGLRPHLPETRLLAGAPDLAAMLVQHDTVFVKHVHGIKGLQAAQVRRSVGGFELCHIRKGEHVVRSFPSLQELLPALRLVTGKGRRVVQQGIAITGREGRPLHFRIVPVRRPEGGWRVLAATASVAREGQTVFTNLANGATDEGVRESLQIHYGMSPAEAARCIDEMEALCLTAAAVLEQAFYPLGLLGFDLVVETASHQTWLLEANAVPGWGYPQEIERELARSQTDLALALTGFDPPEGRCVPDGDHPLS